MKEPKELTNEELALHIEMWAAYGGADLTVNQMAYFDEVIWRLRLSADADK